jgi:hypothetical protein
MATKRITQLGKLCPFPHSFHTHARTHTHTHTRTHTHTHTHIHTHHPNCCNLWALPGKFHDDISISSRSFHYTSFKIKKSPLILLPVLYVYVEIPSASWNKVPRKRLLGQGSNRILPKYKESAVSVDITCCEGTDAIKCSICWYNLLWRYRRY